MAKSAAATTSADAKGNGTSKDEAPSKEEAPTKGPKGSGWDRVNPEDCRVYALKTPGRAYVGRLLGRFPRKDNPKHFYYQLELTDPATGRDGEGDQVELKVGDSINIDEMSGLTELKSVSERDGRWEVYVCFLEKVPVKGGKTFWRLDCQARPLR